MAVRGYDINKMCEDLKLDKENLIKTLNDFGFPPEVEGDTIFIETTPDRPDTLSYTGLIRALKHYLGIEKPKKYRCMGESGFEIKVDESVKKIRPFVVGAVVKDVCFDDEFIEDVMQLQEKLHFTTGRKRKKMAIGIHDLDKIKGTKITYKVSKGDEKFIPLDTDEEMNVDEVLKKHKKGVEYAHLCEEGKLIIEDEEGIISFPPIINSERTKVTKNTRNILIEMTGTHLPTLLKTLNILCCDFIDHRGKIHSVKVDEKLETPVIEYIVLDVLKKDVFNLGGVELNDVKIVANLEKMGYVDVVVDDNKISVKTPPYRFDVWQTCDIVEDLLIVERYDTLPKKPPLIYTVGGLKQGNEFYENLKKILLRMGYFEIKTSFLINKDEIPWNIKIKNPKNVESSALRNNMIYSFMKIFEKNKMKKLPLKFFEIGRVCVDGCVEQEKLCFGVMDEDSCVDELVGVLKKIIDELGVDIEFLDVEDGKSENVLNNIFIKERALKFRINLGERQLEGVLGEISPELLIKFNLDKPVVVAELTIS